MMQPAQLEQGLFGQGLELMLYGMGMVVVFLVVLVYATRLLSYSVRRFFPEPAEPEVPRRDVAPRGRVAPVAATKIGQASQDPKLIAAVVAAVHAHRQRPQE